MVRSVRNQGLVQKLRQDLDAGESAAIALAVELSIPVILMDEKIGRQFARQHSLKATGLLGVLIEAKKQKHLRAIKPLIDQLRKEAGFFISESLYQQILSMVKE